MVFPFDTPITEFQSTLSLRRATAEHGYNITSMSISIHALLAESDNVLLRDAFPEGISIHALLAESDSDSN